MIVEVASCNCDGAPVNEVATVCAIANQVATAVAVARTLGAWSHQVPKVES
jgi:hypothetical protein